MGLFDNFTPEARLMMGAGIMGGKNLADGLSQGAQMAMPMLLANKQQNQMKEVENKTREWLQKQYPGEDFSTMSPDMMKMYANEAFKQRFAKPEKSEFKTLPDGTFGSWDGQKFSPLGKAEKPGDIPAAYQDFLLQQKDPAYKAAKEEELRQKNAPTPQDQFKTTLDTMKTYRSEDAVKTYTATRDAYEKVRTNATLSTAQGDIGLVYGFMKMLDPTSVVREGEYATAQNSGGISDTVINLYNKVLNGERLTEDQRRQFVEAAAAQYDNTVKNLEPVNKRYTDLATDYNVPTDRVLEQPKKYEPLKIGSPVNVTLPNGKKATVEKVSD